MLKKMIKAVFKTALYLMYLLAALLVSVYFFLYLPFVSKIESDITSSDMKVPKNVSASTIEQVAYIADSKNSSFNKFPFAKKEGVIRVGAFGDSFTHGVEVNRNSDYPSILQDLFNQAGYSNVEVLNFGVGGWGASQIFRLMELEGEKYNLDFFIFRPFSFWFKRDLTFGSQNSGSVSGAIHGRYILKNDTIDYIEPLGGMDAKKRFNMYNSFFPKKRYLLYDKNSFALISSFLPKNRYVDNPFYYYKGDYKEEYSQIYKQLLQNTSKKVKQIVIIEDENMGGESYIEKLNLGYSDSINYNKDISVYGRMFDASNSHAGPLKNNAISQQYFNILTGKGEQSIEYFKIISDIGKINFDISSSTSVDIVNIDNITIDFNKIVVGTLITNLRSRTAPNVDHENLQPNNFFRDNKIKSFIFLKDADNNFQKFLYLPLDFDIYSDMKLVLKYKKNNQEHSIDFGNISLVTKNFAYVESEQFLFDDEEHFNSIKTRSGSVYLNIKEDLNDAILFLGENKIYSIGEWKENGDKKNSLYPVKYNHLIFRSRIAVPRHINEYNDSGEVYLSYRNDNKIILREPIGKWVKEILKTSIDTQGLNYVISNSENKGIIRLIKKYEE